MDFNLNSEDKLYFNIEAKKTFGNDLQIHTTYQSGFGVFYVKGWKSPGRILPTETNYDYA